MVRRKAPVERLVGPPLPAPPPAVGVEGPDLDGVPLVVVVIFGGLMVDERGAVSERHRT